MKTLIAATTLATAAFITPAMAIDCGNGNEHFCAQHYGTPMNANYTNSVRFDREYDLFGNKLTTYDRVTREHASQVITREAVTGGSPSDWAGAN